MPRPKKLDPIEAALLDAAEDAEAGVETVGGGAGGGHGFSTEVKGWKPKGRVHVIPTFDNFDDTRAN